MLLVCLNAWQIGTMMKRQWLMINFMNETELRNIAVAQIAETYEKARVVYGREFPLPSLSFDKAGRVAGTAWLQRNHVMLNPVLMEQNLDRFLSCTIPHECAHLIEWQLSGQGGHGREWQRVMRDLGVVDATRCHSYDTSGSSRKALMAWKVRRYE